MWSEEKIRACLAKKQKDLTQMKEKLAVNREWLFGTQFMKAEQVVAATAIEMAEQRATVEKLEHQVEVLKYILDT